jgi:hypothetical protein
MTNLKIKNAVFVTTSITLVGLVIAFVLAESPATDANVPIPTSTNSAIQTEAPKQLPVTVTINQRHDRLDISKHRMAKSNLLSDPVAPPREARALKKLPLMTSELVTALMPIVQRPVDLSGPQALISPLLEQKMLPSSTDTILSGPLNLVAPDVLGADTNGPVMSRTFGSPGLGQRSGPAAGIAGAGGVASGAGRAASGIGGRATGALGL